MGQITSGKAVAVAVLVRIPPGANLEDARNAALMGVSVDAVMLPSVVSVSASVVDEPQAPGSSLSPN